MSKERRQKLFDDYPKLFEKRNDQPENSRPYPIRWGLEHGDGWLPLIEDLCAAIQQRVDYQKKKDPTFRQVEVLQVKEKFGSLRFYISGGDEHIHGMIEMAERVSARTCEECGAPGKMNGKGWLRVRCEPCEAKRAEKWKQHELVEPEN